MGKTKPDGLTEVPSKKKSIHLGSRSKGLQKKSSYARAMQSGLVQENIELWIMILPVLALIFIFSYIPMYGIMIAFQKYVPGVPMLFSDRIQWVGFDNFVRFFESANFWRLIKNTVVLSGLNLIFGFWAPIVFALTLNEVRNQKFKKFTQTASYLPYFISNVVVAGMLLSFLDMDGIVNNITNALGIGRQAWRQNANAFPTIYTITNVWKGFGFNSILYLSAITSVDPALYESARLDGARRIQLIRHITFPAILPTIAIMLIMQIGSLLSANTDLILLLYTPATYSTADVIGTYSYRVGLLGGEFSYTTAMGLFMTVINFALVFLSNRISNKVTGYALW